MSEAKVGVLLLTVTDQLGASPSIYTPRSTSCMSQPKIDMFTNETVGDLYIIIYNYIYIYLFFSGSLQGRVRYSNKHVS